MYNYNQIIEFVKPYYVKKDIMHDLSHIERVIQTAEKLSLNYNVDMDIVKHAAYFHGFIYVDDKSIIRLLDRLGYTNDLIERILQAAWESQKSQNAVTLEGQLLHDAHMIEGGKTFLIVKSLITGSVRGQSLQETISYIENHVLDQGICYLEESQKQYVLSQSFAKEFVMDLKEALYVEK